MPLFAEHQRVESHSEEFQLNFLFDIKRQRRSSKTGENITTPKQIVRKWIICELTDGLAGSTRCPGTAKLRVLLTLGLTTYLTAL